MKQIVGFILLLFPLIVSKGQSIQNTSPIEPEIDASNPLTLGLNAYQIARFKPNTYDLQNIVNYTTEKWFIRGAVDYYKTPEMNTQYGSSSFSIARIINLGNDNFNNKIGLGAVVSHSRINGVSGGFNFVGVQSNTKWKFVELFTYQVNGTIEAQYGAYYKFTKNNLWEVRSHPRMLFNTQTGKREVPVGIGIGHTVRMSKATMYIYCEPEYDIANNNYLIYSGVKFIF